MRIVSMFVGLVLVLAPGCTTPSFRVRTPEDLLVSFPDRLKPGEQIVGFEVYVTNGKIVALNKAPEDWLVNIVAAWWDSTITGTPGHGASAFQDMTPLRRFLTLHKHRAEFNVSGSLVVTTDFTTMTTNHFARSDFIFE